MTNHDFIARNRIIKLFIDVNN